MGYQPNVINKGDIIIINGTRFKALKDFNKQTNNILKLKIINEKPKTYIVTDERLLLKRIRSNKGLAPIGNQ